MYLQTRRKQGNTEYGNTTGQKRGKGLKAEYLPHRYNHTHSDEDDELFEKREDNYSVVAEEPFKPFDRGLTKHTSSLSRQSAQMEQRNNKLQLR